MLKRGESKLQERSKAPEKLTFFKKKKVDSDLSNQGQIVQRKGQTAVLEGKQLRLKSPTEKEMKRHIKNLKGRQKTVQKNHAKNFYVIDVESTGFRKDGGTDEPI